MAACVFFFLVSEMGGGFVRDYVDREKKECMWVPFRPVAPEQASRASRIVMLGGSEVSSPLSR